jgi:hypothetical protein
MTRLFISHSAHDDDFVRDLRRDPLWPEIQKAIEAASACAVVVSRASFCKALWRLGALSTTLFLLLSSASLDIHAQTLATAGCPVFHCTVEATGVVTQPLVPAILVSNSNNELGTLLYQGCSGNGIVLSCLYAIDAASGTAAGTLKVLDGTTLQPLWGSAGVSGSYNLESTRSADGQVPVNFADGTIAAGDNKSYVHYNTNGAVLGKASLTGSGSDFGMTPISASYGIVSQTDGILTLIDLATWKSVSALKLVDPETEQAVRLVSPSSGAPNVLYAVAYASQSRTGWLFSVGVNTTAGQLVVNSSFGFKGTAGASPVVVIPSSSGLPNNLVLLPTPGLNGKPAGQNYLIALEDAPGTGLQMKWSIPVSEAILFTPSVDPNSRSLFYNVPGAPYVHQVSLQTGGEIAEFNIQAIGGFGNQFRLSGHVGASIAGSTTTLLLGAIDTPLGQASTQYALAFQPIAAPTMLLWSEELDTTTVAIGSNKTSPNVYTAAWNFAPSTQAKVLCPIAIAVAGDDASKIVRLCDH